MVDLRTPAPHLQGLPLVERKFFTAPDGRICGVEQTITHRWNGWRGWETTFENGESVVFATLTDAQEWRAEADNDNQVKLAEAYLHLDV